MKKITMLAIMLISVSIGIATQAHAGGYLVMGATVTSVTNSDNNAESFIITTSGSYSGPCGATSIYFSRANAGSDDIFKRAYVNAMTAFVTGMKVHVYNFVDTTCVNASYIQIMK